MVSAFFDIDHTLICGSSMERIFVRYLLRRGHVTVTDILRTLTYISLSMWDTTGIIRRSRRPYLKGKSVALIETLAEQCFKDAIEPLIANCAVSRIRRHREAGYKIVLISGTLEILAGLLSQHVHADHYIACRTEEVDGHFTGGVMSSIPYGEGKRTILVSYALEQGIDLKQSFAYGDSMADIGVFESVGNPCAVNPGRRLRAIARKRGWEIERW